MKKILIPLHATDKHKRYVKTTGTVSVMIPADSALLHVSLSTLEPTLEKSNKHLDDLIKTLQTELNTRGISSSDVTLKNRDVDRRWRNIENNKSEFLGYRASVMMLVSIRDISKLSPLIMHIGLHDEYGSSWPSLRSSKIGAEKNAVLALALRVAREKAQILAQEGGAKLGALLKAEEELVRNESAFSGMSQRVVEKHNVVNDDNDSDVSTPKGDHMISINVRIRAAFALVKPSKADKKFRKDLLSE